MPSAVGMASRGGCVRVSLGLNLEYSRRHDWSFQRAVEEAAGLGYEYVEPMVHLGRQLLSEGGYLHSLSMSEDPLWALESVRGQRSENFGALLARPTLQARSRCRVPAPRHTLGGGNGRPGRQHLGRPQTVLDQPRRGHGPDWLLAEGGAGRCRAARGDDRPGAAPAIQRVTGRHGRTAGSSAFSMDRCQFRYRQRLSVRKERHYGWMEHVRDRLVHVHAKDISAVQGAKERGKVSGTAVGCACGDGVIDWRRIVRICLDAPRDIVLSVECGSREEAKRSHAHLSRILAESAIPE